MDVAFYIRFIFSQTFAMFMIYTLAWLFMQRQTTLDKHNPEDYNEVTHGFKTPEDSVFDDDFFDNTTTDTEETREARSAYCNSQKALVYRSPSLNYVYFDFYNTSSSLRVLLNDRYYSKNHIPIKTVTFDTTPMMETIQPETLYFFIGYDKNCKLFELSFPQLTLPQIQFVDKSYLPFIRRTDSQEEASKKMKYWILFDLLREQVFNLNCLNYEYCGSVSLYYFYQYGHGLMQ